MPAAPREWWPENGLYDSALATGWRPTPFQEFVVKVQQRCNLACDYCYIYTKSDQSWKSRPPAMPEAIWKAAARRIGDHASTHGLRQVRLILHGGEPLLIGPRQLVRIADDLRAELPAHCTARVSVQTNGTRLDAATLRLLRDHHIRVGVSVDGPPAAQDRSRRYHDGRPSSRRVAKALGLLASDEFRPVFAGLLCVVDLRTDPRECLEHLLSWEPPAIDFLLPHANWASRPVYPRPAASPSYAHWLGSVFDAWYETAGRRPRVPLLDSVLDLLLGGRSRTEQVGLSPVAVAVVEGDGAIELVDSLKSTYPAASATQLNVLTSSFDAALRHPGVVARQIGVAALPDDCRDCAIHQVCGGGNYAHRYAPANGFRNPTVYCHEMIALITHVRNQVLTDLKID